MAGDSTAAGYLAPASAPLDDDALTDFLQLMVVGITGLPGAMVKPRWQGEPPNLPPYGTNWAAVGLGEIRPDTYAAHTFDPAAGDGMQRHEEFDLLCSFYGPAAGANAAALRDGLQVAQNREPLLLAGMGLVSTSSPQRVPDLLKQRWTGRIDMTVTLRRQIIRTYPVRNLSTVAGSITTNSGGSTFRAG